MIDIFHLAAITVLFVFLDFRTISMSKSVRTQTSPIHNVFPFFIFLHMGSLSSSIPVNFEFLAVHNCRNPYLRSFRPKVTSHSNICNRCGWENCHSFRALISSSCAIIFQSSYLNLDYSQLIVLVFVLILILSFILLAGHSNHAFLSFTIVHYGLMISFMLSRSCACQASLLNQTIPTFPGSFCKSARAIHSSLSVKFLICLFYFFFSRVSPRALHCITPSFVISPNVMQKL